MARTALALDLEPSSPPNSEPVRSRRTTLREVAFLDEPRAASERERWQRQNEAHRDRDLVQRARRGDQRAFELLVRHYEKRAFALAVTVLRDENDAKEIVQEAFLRVYRGLSTFNGESSFFTWLYCIVKNLSIDLLRRPVRRETERLAPLDFEQAVEAAGWARGEQVDPFSQLQRGEVERAVHRCLGDLPPYHRGVLVMRELLGFSYEEMADEMGVSKGTIMSRLFHARRKLQIALADCYADQAR
jgi:RNA polymerase sigma-70 factor (ECF subfamily)